MPRHEAKVARLRRGGVGLLMIGDSITHGWEAAGREVWRRYYAHRRAVNLGFNGDRTEHFLWRLMNGELEGSALSWWPAPSFGRGTFCRSARRASGCTSMPCPGGSV